MGDLHVRDLKPGMVVPVGNGKTATVASVEWMNGKNGEAALFTAQQWTAEGYIHGKSALAKKIHFHDHESLISHPASVVG